MLWLGAALLALGTAACSSSTSSNPSDEGVEPGAVDIDDPGGEPDIAEPTGSDPVAGGPTCGFDPEQQGKIPGRHVKNFGLKTYENEAYWLHQNCGTDKKVVWLILATGW